METKAAYTGQANERELRNRQLALQAATEGIVLLENDGTLPLKAGKTALFGAGAGYTIRGGSGSGEVNARYTVTVEEGLEEAGFTVTTKDWIRKYEAVWKKGKEAYLKENRKKLLQFSTKVLADLMAAEYRYPDGCALSEEEIRRSDTDTCIYVLSRQSGEGHDRKDEEGSFRLTENEIRNIALCAEEYKRFVLVINTGSAIDLSPLDKIDGVNAVVYMNQLGMEGGRALAKVLCGEAVPSGKLAVTWPQKYGDVPAGSSFGPYSEDSLHAKYTEGIYNGYRYYDSFDVEPRYPFGYGKSYTDFTIENTEISLKGRVVEIRCKVTNKGKVYSGKEVVQVYVRCPKEHLDHEVQRLAAFGKTKQLAPGESEELKMSFDLSLLSSYDQAKAETVLEKGNYILNAGSSSRCTEAAAVLVCNERIVLSRHKNLCGSKEMVTKLRTEYKEEKELPQKQLVIDPSVMETVVYGYEKKEPAFSKRTRDYLEQLKPEELVKFCAGTGLFGEERGFRTPGSVGHTTTDFLERGIPNRELCDGPAGLRIQRRSTINSKGKIKAVDTSISLYEFLPGWITKFLLGNPKKETMIYQYVTAFPVAAAIAQSWNTDLAYKIGDAVGDEMEEYGVTWWLAPALNIVRNPLCGRNYEYYSEDPLISGKFAAAVSRGVQKHSGCFVTIKHFAANNQEENRYYVSSDADERVLREIYFKGFEIAVKEGAPKAVMTAYNRINDVYCANQKELCTDLLRSEWGFDGVVMTDWLSTGKDRADEAGCLNAGADLIMPGGKKVVETLLKGYAEGRFTEKTLKTSAGRVLEEILAGNQ